MSEENEINKRKEITISLPAEEYTLGGPIPLEVIYHNISGGRLEFFQPEKQRSVKLCVTSRDGRTIRGSFGRVFVVPVNDEYQRYVPEDAEKVILLKDQTYEFTYDLTRRFYEILPPGRHELQVTDKVDESPRVNSNEVPLSIYFRQESVPYLMNIVGDDKADASLREWAAGWLREFRADFKPQFARADDPDSIKAGCRTATSEELDKFRSWWATMQGTDKVRGQIAAINEESFAPVEKTGSDLESEDEEDAIEEEYGPEDESEI